MVGKHQGQVAFAIAALISLFCLKGQALGPEGESPDKTVRVRLRQGVKDLKISGYGLQSSSFTNFTPVAIPRKKQTLSISRLPKFWQIDILQDGFTRRKIFANKSQVYLKGQSLEDQGQALPGELIINLGKKIEVIGVLPMQDYLLGVVGHEMPRTWPLEALKAQAVAARSYALAVKRQRKNQSYDLESSILDQVFKVPVSADESQWQNVKLAVEQTEDEVLLDQTGKALKAYYHSHCGGKTAKSSAVWGSPEIETVVNDASCAASAKPKWSALITADKIVQNFFPKTLDPQKRLTSAQNLKLNLIRDSENQKIDWVEVQTPFEIQKIRAQDFRKQMGFQIVKSNLYELKSFPTKSGPQFQFVGSGNGHGVGLCQWGSRDMAMKGKAYQDILTHYYPGFRLSKKAEAHTIADGRRIRL